MHLSIDDGSPLKHKGQIVAHAIPYTDLGLRFHCNCKVSLTFFKAKQINESVQVWKSITAKIA